jgi:hypothetical protein
MDIGEVISAPSSPWQNPCAEKCATEGRVVAFPEVGGLHHRYERRAA